MSEVFSFLILFISFLIGQVVHVIKKNNIEQSIQLKEWYRQNCFTFWIQVFLGLSILQVMMFQLNTPTNFSEWFSYFYIGVNAGMTSSSAGMSVYSKFDFNKFLRKSEKQ